MARIMSFCCAIVVMAALSACAASRSVIEIKPEAPASAAAAGAPAVRLGKVTDARLFEVDSSDSSMPSLSSSDIKNDALKARAVGRKRGGFGAALGDVMLPEGQTVSGLLSAATENGLTRAGFRVLHKGDPGYDDAAVVDVWISKYWTWVTMGALEGAFHTNAEVELTSSLPAFHKTTVARGHADEGGWKGNWDTVATTALNNMVEDIAVMLKQK